MSIQAGHEDTSDHEYSDDEYRDEDCSDDECSDGCDHEFPQATSGEFSVHVDNFFLCVALGCNIMLS